MPAFIPCLEGLVSQPTAFWQTVLYSEPEPPRRLTLPELRRLAVLGFPELAERLAAGTCLKCQMNKSGRGHHDLCVTAVEKRNPKPAPGQPRQPWEPRESRAA
jgi:hypothetical protein